LSLTVVITNMFFINVIQRFPTSMLFATTRSVSLL